MTDDLLRRYATSVTAGVDDPAVLAAFASVPRHLFVPRILDQDGVAMAATPDLVYADEALVTRLRDGWPSSSSSQPSLMAQMLAALKLRPGLRVLEIGAGTGYNAALIATITGTRVVSIDVQPEVVAEARAAVDRAGVGDVTVRLADGYLGAPRLGPYDRIIATVGVGGVPPSWLDQLAPGGLVLAPIEHGGIQPCVAGLLERGGLTGRAAAASGFMLAAGPLHPRGRPPEPLVVHEPPPRIPIPATPERRYYDLWFALAARDRRITRRPVAGYDETGTQCVLVDPTEGSVLVQGDTLRPIGAPPALVDHVRALVEEWHAAGTPPVTAWRCGFHFANGLWTPADWRCDERAG